jgi:hypothetical protein
MHTEPWRSKDLQRRPQQLLQERICLSVCGSICPRARPRSYWNYNRPEDAGLQGRPEVPTLNLMGFEDEYFGVNNSVAATVAAYGGYPPIAGHAFEAMLDRCMPWGLVSRTDGRRLSPAFAWVSTPSVRKATARVARRRWANGARVE